MHVSDRKGSTSLCGKQSMSAAFVFHAVPKLDANPCMGIAMRTLDVVLPIKRTYRVTKFTRIGFSPTKRLTPGLHMNSNTRNLQTMDRPVCVLHIEPLSSPVDVQDNQCPCQLFSILILRRDTDYLVTTLRHRDTTLPSTQ